jgi:hypothetical protein
MSATVGPGYRGDMQRDLDKRRRLAGGAQFTLRARPRIRRRSAPSPYPPAALYGRLQLGTPEPPDDDDDDLETPAPTTTSLRQQLLKRTAGYVGWARACDRLADLTRWHGLDPRLTPELALVILADAARGGPDEELRGGARHAIWNLGLLEID